MSKQNKRSLCACGCGSRKTSRKMKFIPGHNGQRRDTKRNDDLETKRERGVIAPRW